MVRPLRIVFFGTPAFAVPSLRTLIASAHEVVAVVTQPDRPRGRGRRILPEAVKRLAVDTGLPVLQPERLRESAFLQTFAGLAPHLGVVAAYGKLLPEDLLGLPPLGMINVHASLLPRWRGAAPVHRAILAGDTVTGVSIMRVVQALDAGPVLASASTPIGPDETSAELELRLSDLGARLLRASVDELAAGRCTETPQDESAVTYAAKLERRESEIDWARPARAVHNQIRGLQPWPLAAALFHNQRTMILRSTVAREAPHHAAPGTVTGVLPEAIDVATSPGIVRLLEIQIAGRPVMPVGAFLRGHRVREGDRFLPLSATT